MKLRDYRKQPYWALHTYCRKCYGKSTIRVNARTSDIGTINSNNRTSAILYSLGTWFVSGIYVSIPCMKAGQVAQSI
jgi:hypothetical protein